MENCNLSQSIFDARVLGILAAATFNTGCNNVATTFVDIDAVVVVVAVDGDASVPSFHCVAKNRPSLGRTDSRRFRNPWLSCRNVAVIVVVVVVVVVVIVVVVVVSRKLGSRISLPGFLSCSMLFNQN